MRPIAVPVALSFAALTACTTPTASPPNALAPSQTVLSSAQIQDNAAGGRLFTNAACQFKPFSGLCVFSFPFGRYIGWIEYYGGGAGGVNDMCAARNGDVFMTGALDSGAVILEYAHDGGGPTKVLNDGSNVPFGCSSDPTTGNLAVANLTTYGYKGDVAVFTNASGDAAFYHASNLSSYDFCGYDNLGDLFTIGTNKSGSVEIAEMPAGSDKFTPIELNKRLEKPGPIQFDGKHLAIGYGDTSGSLIYQITIAGHKATVVGSTKLAPPSGSASFGPFWISGARIVASYTEQRGHVPVGIWNYPQGGQPAKVIRRGGKDYGSLRTLTVSTLPAH